MTGTEHWNNVYGTKSADTVSWYQPIPQPSLEAIARFGGRPGHSLIDIGGGASSLAARLAAQGWRDLAVLDISQAALESAKQAMGEEAGSVDWIVADISDWSPTRTYDIWHDRAVFHFLTDEASRAGYHSALAHGLSAGGLLLIATFALDGPEKCSGLPVQRYDPEGLATEFGDGLEPLDCWREVHRTPWGSEQNFTWCAFRRRAA